MEKRTSPLSIALITLGTFQLMKKQAYPVLLAVLTFGMVSALTWSVVSRVADKVEQNFAAELSMTHEEVSQEISTQLLALSDLPFDQFIDRVSENDREAIITNVPKLTKEQLGLAYAVQVGPYLIAQLCIHVLNIFCAMIYFLLLFTRGSITGFDAARLLPKALFGSFGVVLSSITRPLFFLTGVGTFLALTVYLSGETGIRASTRLASVRLFSHFFRVMIVSIGVALLLFVALWTLLIITTVISLVSFKIAFFMLLCSLILVIALFSAALTMLSAMLA